MSTPGPVTRTRYTTTATGPQGLPGPQGPPGAAAGQIQATLSNGLNSNIATGGQPTVRLAGPSAAFSVGGFQWPGAATPQAGQQLDVVNTTTQPMTIVHEDASSAAVARIDTPTGKPMLLPANGSAARLVFDGAASRWRLSSIGAISLTVVNVLDYGAVSDNSTDNTTAFSNAYAALPAAGGTILVPDGGVYKTNGLTFTKPIRLQVGCCTIKGNNAAALITTNTNLIVHGHSQYESQLQPSAGQTAVALAGTWPLPLTLGGNQVFRMHDVGVTGGLHAIDTSGLTLGTFSQGLWKIDHCLFQNTTGVAVVIASEVSFTFVEFCQYTNCQGSVSVADNTETKFQGNTYWPPTGATVATMVLAAPSRVHVMRDTFVGAANMLVPDIQLYGSEAGSIDGIAKIEKCYFGSEREFSYDTRRCRILSYNPSVPNAISMDVELIGNHFYFPGIGLFPATVVVTAGTARATITLPAGQTDHGIQIGDEFSFVGSATTSLNGGPFTCTGRSSTYVEWTTTSGDPTGLVGYVLPGGDVAPIVLTSPVGNWRVDDNLFFGYPCAVNDSAYLKSEDFLNLSGRSVFGPGNRLWGPAGRECVEFAAGGQQFDQVYRGSTSPVASSVPASQAGFLNRAYPSEGSPSHTGVTVTTGQTDPFGGTAAYTLTRAGTNQLWSGIPGSLLEGAHITVDIGTVYALPDDPPRSYLTFWAKTGGGNPSDSLTVWVADGSGYVLIFETVTLTDAWRQYQIPITWPASFVSSLSGTAQLYFAPGSFQPEPATCQVFGWQVSDTEQCDAYVKTTSGAAVAWGTAQLAAINGGTATGTSGLDFTLTPQVGTAASGNVQGGRFIIPLQTPTGSGVESSLTIERGGATHAAIGPYPGSPTVTAVWLGLVGNPADTGHICFYGSPSIFVFTVNAVSLNIVDSTDNTHTIGSQTNRYAGLYVAGMQLTSVGLGGDPFTSGTLQLSTNPSFLATSSNISLSAAQAATPVAQMNGTVQSGGCTVTLPNIIGSLFYFDITDVTFGANGLTFTTGSGTTAAVTGAQGAAFQAAGKNLLTVAVVASHFVSVG